MDKKKEKAETPKTAVSENKENPQLKVKQGVFVSARNKNFFGCIKDTPIEDIEISDTHVTFKMGSSSKRIETDDLICVSATPQSLHDQNCLSVFYKEFTDARKTKFKIAEFKIACARSVSKLIMIEKLRLNVKNKFSFDHLKLADEKPAEEYLKGLVNKPRQVYQGIKIIHFVYFYKNAMHFLSVFKKRFNKDKNLINAELDKLLNKQLGFDLHSDNNSNLAKHQDKKEMSHENNIIKLSSDKDNLEEFVKQKNLNIEINNNGNINNFNNGNRGINDSNLFSNDNLHNNENNSAQYLPNNSRVKIYEKKDSREGFDDMLMHHDINFNGDTEHLKESTTDFKKIIMQNQTGNDGLMLSGTKNIIRESNISTENNLHNMRNSKDLISFKKVEMDPRSINDYDTFHGNKINKEEKNIRTNILDGQASPNPGHLDRRLSIEKRNSFERNQKKQFEDDYEIINPRSEFNIENEFNNNQRMKIYKD